MSSSQPLKLREVRHDDHATLQRVAELHVRLLSPGPLAEMGVDFAREVGFRLLLADGLLRLVVIEGNGELGGFVAFTDRSDTYQRDSFRRHPLKVIGAALAALLQRPARLRALRHMAHDMPSTAPPLAGHARPVGEVVAIVVTPEFLHLAAADKGSPHPGDLLLDAAIEQLRRGKIGKLRARINADRRGALLLYARRGAKYQDYRDRGEDMVQVTLDL